MSFLQIRELVKVYGNDVDTQIRALDGVDLSIEQGDFISVSGPSGSGKTTLLNMVGGLDQPNSGSVELSGRNIVGLKESKLSQIRLHEIGFVFQAYNLIPVLTAMENMEYILMLQGMPKADRQSRVIEFAEVLEIRDLLHKRPNEMSGGQQQRVAVARAIVSKPSLVLADEPTANLDTKRADRLMTLMQRLNDELKITFIFSTHDSRVMEKSKRNVKLQDGIVVSDAHI